MAGVVDVENLREHQAVVESHRTFFHLQAESFHMLSRPCSTSASNFMVFTAADG